MGRSHQQRDASALLFPERKEGDLILSTEGIGRFRKEEDIGLSFQMEHVCLFNPEDGHPLL